jgi:hypothetical protein
MAVSLLTLHTTTNAPIHTGHQIVLPVMASMPEETGTTVAYYRCVLKDRGCRRNWTPSALCEHYIKGD